MKQACKKSGRVLSAVFLLVLILFSSLNAGLVIFPFGRLLCGQTDFSGAVREVHAAYVSSFSFKNTFIDLNGAYARMTGRRVYHGVSRLPNGMLDREQAETLDVSPLSDAISTLSEELESLGIPLLYVQNPCKNDLAGVLLPKGTENTANRCADTLCKLLLERGTDVLDLRPLLAKDASLVERYFYRTDHHWNTDGAFCAFGEILRGISARLSDRTVELSWGDAERWERTVYERWFLGSHGKRVGRFFGGVDDLILYTPKESVQTRFSVPYKGILKEGDFSETVLEPKYLDAPDYFGENPYCVYIGGDYPLSVHQTSGIKNGAHVLLIKDSFSLPVEAMLSCALSRLDVIDPRYYKDGSVLEYARDTCPDLVIVALNPSVFSDVAYHSLQK